MPIACDPNQTFRVVLDGDKNKTPQPAFLCRVLTKRQWREAAKLHDAVFDRNNKNSDEMADRQSVALRFVLAGWENIPGQDGKIIPYEFEKHEDVLTIQEVFEILNKAEEGQRLTADDKKKLDSPSGSDTGNPAAIAPV